MIHIDRRPSILSGAADKHLRTGSELAREYFELKGASQSRFQFDRNLLSGVVDPLTSLFLGKCAFCESKIPFISGNNITQFRPISDARDFGGDFSYPHYWWLGYEWSNLYLACSTCIAKKETYFPVAGKRAGVEAAPNEIKKEKNLILDPCTDKPESCLDFDDNGVVYSRLNGRQPLDENLDPGSVTIRIFDLNREELVKSRKGKANELLRIFSDLDIAITKPATGEIMSLLHELVNASDAHEEYLALTRRMVDEYLSSRKSIRKQIKLLLGDVPNFNLRGRQPPLLRTPVKTTTGKITPSTIFPGEKYAAVYIRHLSIKNYRAIGKLEMSFNDEEENPISKTLSADTENTVEKNTDVNEWRAGWKVLLGENGCGKTSVLKAIGLALGGKDYYESHLKKFVPKDKLFNRNTTQEDGFIKLELSKGEPIIIEFRRNSPPDFTSRPMGLPESFVRGFGATRIVEPKETDTKNEDRAKPVAPESLNILNLFSPWESIAEPTKWLAGLDGDNFISAGKTIRTLLAIPDEIQPVITKSSRGVYLRSDPGKPHPIVEYSHGYRSILTLVADIFSGLPGGLGDKDNAAGIVLLDELDLHLHPKWKMRIVGALRECFPRIQFICTTHEPLCLRGLGKREITVMSRNEHFILVDDDTPSPVGLRVDQLLTSPLFGMQSTIDPAIDAKFREYYRLLAKAKLRPFELERKELLRNELKQFNTLGFTRRDQLVYELVDKFLAEAPRSHPIKEIDDGLKKTVLDLWNFSPVRTD